MAANVANTEDVSHFSNQDEMTLVTGSGFVMNEYMKSLPDDTLMKEILLKTCYSAFMSHMYVECITK